MVSTIWIHLSCGLWTPEIFLEEKKSVISIKGVENIDKKRFALTCCICKIKSFLKEKKLLIKKYLFLESGACIQCIKSKCHFAFHPECARRANHYMEIKEEEKVIIRILKSLNENKNKKIVSLLHFLL